MLLIQLSALLLMLEVVVDFLMGVVIVSGVISIYLTSNAFRPEQMKEKVAGNIKFLLLLLSLFVASVHLKNILKYNQ